MTPGPSQDVFFLLEAEKLNDEGPGFLCSVVTRSEKDSGGLLKTSEPVAVISRFATKLAGSWPFSIPLAMLIILRLDRLDLF